jgi:hypothetical protein
MFGAIDERGFINSFDRKGFTHKKGGSELLSNSHDAGSTRVLIDVCRDKIKLIDNGRGMNITQLGNMFTMYRENHTGDKSMGVSGVGAKPSLYLLSKRDGNPSPVTIFTHTEDGEYLKAIVPFDKMKEEGKYTGMIEHMAMTEEEMDEFNADRGNPVGTTITMKYSETTHEYFEKQFSNDRKTMDLSDRLDCIFGKTKMEISYRDYESAEGTNKKLPLYDYFGGERPAYYAGIKEDIIEHWLDRDNKDRFVWENGVTEWEFTPKSKNISKKPEPVQCKTGWTNIGFYLLKNGMRRDVRLFDERNPVKTMVKNKNDAVTVVYGNQSYKYNLCEYDEEFFEGGKEELKINIGKLFIMRNEQYIASIELDEFKITSARASADAFMKTVLHRTELSYCTKSCHENRMDMAIGIQENKNQHVASDIPANLTRLISHIKKLRYSEIIDYFELKCKEINDEYERVQKEELERQRELERVRQEEMEKLRKEELEKANLEKARKEELEMLRQEELEKQANLEKLRKEELEKQANLEKVRKEELEKANLEKLRKEELEKANLEKLRKEELEKQANLEKLRKEELEKQANLEKLRKEELENQANLERANLEPAQAEELEAKQRKVSEMVQTRMTVANGIKALNHIKQENLTEHHDLINDMLISYSDRCAADQLKQYILVLTFGQRIDILLVLIDEKYQGNNEADMKEGAKLFRALN